MLRTLRTCFLGLSVFVLLTSLALAERPPAPELFPADTVALLRVTDVDLLKDRFHETAFGQMVGDVSVQQTVGQLWLRVKEAIAEQEKAIGATAEEILGIPQGEIAFGIVPVPLSQPAFLLIADVGDSPLVLRDLIEQAEQAMLGNGSDFNTKKFGETEVSIFETIKQDKTDRLIFFERDGAICIASHEHAAEQVIRNWDNDRESDPQPSPLASAPNYKSTMRHVRVGDAHEPQFYLFADVIGFARAATRGNVAANAGIAMLPMLGLDNLKSVGLSWTMVHDDFDSLVHGHVLLETPRKGILDMVALEKTEIEPEPWVPEDALTYTSFQWDTNQTLTALDDMLTRIKGKGTLDAWLQENVSNPLGVDAREELIEEATGRCIRVEWMEPPLRPSSQSSLLAVELRDAERFLASMDKVVSKVGDAVRPISMGSLTAYRVNRPDSENDEEGARPRRPGQRGRSGQMSRDATFMVMGDYFFFADRPGILRKVLETEDFRASLSKSKRFDEATSIAIGLRGGKTAGLYTYFDAEWVYRHRYALLTTSDNLQRFSDRFGDNEFFQGLIRTLRESPLPPFETLKRYVSQTGASIISDEESGLHYTSFLLKRRADREKKAN